MTRLYIGLPPNIRMCRSSKHRFSLILAPLGLRLVAGNAGVSLAGERVVASIGTVNDDSAYNTKVEISCHDAFDSVGNLGECRSGLHGDLSLSSGA